MDFARSLLMSIPITIAWLVLAAVAVFKIGKNKGNIFILIGAIFLFFINILYPLFWRIFMELFKRVSDPWIFANLFISILNAVGILIIAAGLFINNQDTKQLYGPGSKPPAVSQ